MVSAMGRTAILLACEVSVPCPGGAGRAGTHVFDVWAGVDGDHVAVLDAEVVANDAVNSSATVVEAFIGQDDENGVLSLLAAD